MSRKIIEITYKPSSSEIFCGLKGRSVLKLLVGVFLSTSTLVLVLSLTEKFLSLPVFFCLAFFLVGIYSAFAILSRNAKFKIDTDGIRFPFLSFLLLGPRLNYTWQEIEEVEFLQSNSVDSRLKAIRIILSYGKTLEFQVDGFRKNEFQSLIKSMHNIGRVGFSPPLKALELGLGESKEDSLVSHTGLWLNEYNRRYAPTAFVPLCAGDKLQDGRVEILGEIAAGGMSAIYLAASDIADPCIVKESVLPDADDVDMLNEVTRLFEREAMILASLEHPRIVSVFDYFVENAKHYLIMQYIPGTNLRTYIKGQNELAPEQALIWAVDIAKIIFFLHSSIPPIVHRDLTPDNFILEDDGQISLIDFGAANYLLSTLTGTIVGKASYMPAEQLKGKPVLASDIYSFAKTIQFLITGIDPEPLESCKVDSDAENLRRDIQELLFECTLDEPERRPSARDVLKRLENMSMDRALSRYRR